MSFIGSITSDYLALWNTKLYNSTPWSRVFACVTYELELTFLNVSLISSSFPHGSQESKKKYIDHGQGAVFCPFVRHLKSHLHTVIIFHAKINLKSRN